MTVSREDTQRSLLQNVRTHFHELYNSPDKAFQEFLVSVGNKDAITGRRDFDRHEAVRLIKRQAKLARDTITSEATDGEVYGAMVKVMRNHPELKMQHHAVPSAPR